MEAQRPEALSIAHLAKSFGRLSVLSDITLSVFARELVCVLGPSGCGKTTILRCIAGLIPFDSGTVASNGRQLKQREPREQGIGLIFQEPRLLPWRTARDNVRLPFELRGIVTPADDEAVRLALALVGLTDFASSYPQQLSGGMRQRLALARALVTDPRILLMDEPLTGLDMRTKEELQDEIIRIWAQKGMSLLWVTHDPAEAIYLADRIIVLTGRPTRIKSIIIVDLPRPRLRDSDAVRELEKTIRDLFGEDTLHESPRH